MALIGPTHPYSGGIAQHTTRLAQELDARGIPVRVESWKAQYPTWLYPGQQQVPENNPELGLAPRVRNSLKWFDPLSWWAAGVRMRSDDAVVFAVPTPFHAIPYLLMISVSGSRCRSIALIHNVRPHEPGQLDTILMRRLVHAVDACLVHSPEAKAKIRKLTAKKVPIAVSSLPSPWVGPTFQPKPRNQPQPRILFFGKVRHYKGLDLLLEALSKVDGITLLIVGEFWDSRSGYERRIEKLGIENRVEIREGYVPANRFEEVFSEVDALVMPYRSGSGSIVQELGFSYGLPVIASDAGSIAEGIIPGETGAVVPAGDVDRLVLALRELLKPKTLSRWKKGVSRRTDKNSDVWTAYCQTLLKAASQFGTINN